MAQSNDAANFEMPKNQAGFDDLEKAGKLSSLDFGGIAVGDSTAAAPGD